MLFLFFINELIFVICILVSVAFLTILEHKWLGYIQIREGPNKVRLLSTPQPFCDAFKLLTKEQAYSILFNYISCCVPFFVELISFNLGLLFFLSCTRLGVYTVAVACWSSNSNYALLGGFRDVA